MIATGVASGEVGLNKDPPFFQSKRIFSKVKEDLKKELENIYFFLLLSLKVKERN